MKQLRVAILGQGRSGRDIHGAHLLTDAERFKVVAVVDPIEIRRQRAAETFACDVYEEYTQLFGRTDIDFVINATPSHLHQPISIDLMRNGFNVMSEKPIARTAAEVDELSKVSQETGKMFAIFLQSRYAPQFVAVRNVVDSGVLGRLIQVSVSASGYMRRWDWQTLQEFNAGSLYNTGPHPVGQALEFLDYYDGKPNVLCKMDRVNTWGDAEDYVKLILTAPDRPLIDIEISSCNDYLPTFMIEGSKGCLKADNEKVEWKYFKPEEAPEQHLIKTPLSGENQEPIYCRESLTWYKEEMTAENIRDNVFSDATRRLYDDIYAHLTQGTPLPVKTKEVRQAIAIMEEAHKQNPMPRFDD